MSRIGNREITILDGVEVKEENGIITVKGPKGELSMKLAKEIKMEVNEGKIHLLRLLKLMKLICFMEQ
jgi:large subunit ribosomal protein L6